MKTKVIAKGFSAVWIRPPAGTQNPSVLRRKPGRMSVQGNRKIPAAKITGTDCNKFEKDIEDAFEQVP